MKLYSEGKEYKLYQGDMLDMLEVVEPNSIDSIVTDPPYELNFMGKGWDNSGIAFQPSTWLRCLEVLKPGGYLLAFGGSRTYHRIACAIEDAGFEIRDTIMWLYGSGFPKSMNLGKAIESKLVNGSANTKDWKSLDGTKIESGNWGMNKLGADLGYRERAYDEDNHLRVDKVDYQTEAGKKWDGWGSALKPSYEPIIVARKPFDGTLVDNVLKFGVGGYNIDECRVGTDVISGGTMPDFRDVGKKQKEISGIDKLTFGQVENAQRIEYEDHVGRFPANTILTYDENNYEEVCGGFPQSKGATSQNNYSNGHIYRGQSLNESNTSLNGYREWYNDDGSASRYFYNAKVSDKDEDVDRPTGRFPANTILTYDETDEEEVCGGFPESKGSSSQNVYTKTPKYYGNALFESSTKRFSYQEGYNDRGSASRYFYCAKASKKDRDEGLDRLENKKTYQIKEDTPQEIIDDIKRLLSL